MSRGMSASIWAPRVGDTAEQSSGQKDVPLTGSSQRDPFKSLLNTEVSSLDMTSVRVQFSDAIVFSTQSARDCQKGGNVTSKRPRNKAEASEQVKGSRDGANVRSASMMSSDPMRNTNKEIPSERLTSIKCYQC